MENSCSEPFRKAGRSDEIILVPVSLEDVGYRAMVPFRDLSIYLKVPAGIDDCSAPGIADNIGIVRKTFGYDTLEEQEISPL